MRRMRIVLFTHFARFAARQRLRLELSAKKLRPHRRHEEASAVRSELIGRPFEALRDVCLPLLLFDSALPTENWPQL